MKRFAVFVVFVVLAMLVIGSCAAQSATNEAQKLVGTWVGEYTDHNGETDAITLVFDANGTGTFSYSYGSDSRDIFWGVSTSGELGMWVNSNFSGHTFFLSPDGSRMIYEEIVYQKQ